MNAIRKGWQSWKRIGQYIGDFIARVALSIFYFTIFLPFGLGVRLLGDPLNIHPNHRPSWLQRGTRDLTLEDGRRLS